MLLKNGLASHGKVSVQTSNTCSFDSLYFAVAAMYANYGNVRNQIVQLAPTCTFSKMVTTMFESFDRIALKYNSSHRQRNEILHSIFKSDELRFECGLVLVDYIIPKALPINLYSYSRKKECALCAMEITSNRCFVDINFEQYKKRSVKQLNACLIETSILEEPSLCECGGTQNITETVFSNFIMIDLHLESTIEEIALKDIPKTLIILGIEFALTACIEFIGEMPKDLSSAAEMGVAHYITHILRSNDHWQTYDDLKSHILPSNTNSKIKGQVLLYVKLDDI